MSTTSARKSQELPLPSIELAAYALWFSLVLGYAGYAFKTQISADSLLSLDETSLHDGLFGYKRDNTYADWNLYLSMLPSILVLLSLHLLLSRVTLRYCHLQLHHLACAGFTLLLSCRLLSVRCTLMLLGLHSTCLASACLAGRLAVWPAVGLAFWQFNGAAFGDNRQLRISLQLDSMGSHVYYPITGYLYCRFLSMGLCLSASAAVQSDPNRLRRIVRHLPESLHYAFYLPNFLGAPVVTMDDFVRQRTRPVEALSSLPMRQIVSRLCRLTLWLAVTVAIVHGFHAGAYLETLPIRLVRFRRPISYAQLLFAMYTRGQLFQLEYMQYYGWSALLASLDGIQLPHWPACICRVASYREMWRLFDRGLFAIIRDHLYIPLGGSQRGLARQLLATAASFGFICVYHGNYDSVQAWILLNLLLVIVELAAVRMYRAGLRDRLLRWMSPTNLRRLVAALAAANLIPPSMGIFFLFYGTQVGWLVMREALWLPLTGQSPVAGLLLLYSAFYCSVQLAFEYKQRRNNSAED